MNDRQHHRGPAPEHRPDEEKDSAGGPKHDHFEKSHEGEPPEGYADEQTKAPGHPDVEEDDANPKPTEHGH